MLSQSTALTEIPAYKAGCVMLSDPRYKGSPDIRKERKL